ncbi:TerB N-terminal domain-containing protein [Paenibacillus jiagnxiensis]|uniref:TerB N-terminal domain-containing protein n=1 Tax=Paenibacillus jiagnxiensis TaxID=3228926 RepID=UPI0033BA66C8
MDNKSSQDIGFAELFIDEEEPEISRTPKAAPPVRSQASLEDFDLLEKEHGYPATREANFVHQARQWADREGSRVPFQPFMSYWPTYSQMNGPQTEWYFYWRSEVRRKRYPETDLSYIFIYIYELIHGIGWKEPEEGFQLLLELREAYADRYPGLLEYMADWLTDFVLVHHLPIPFEELIISSPAAMRGELFDLVLTRLLEEEKPVLPLEIVLGLSEYNMRRSAFYRSGGKEALDKHIPQVITLVDAYMGRTQGRRLKDAFDPGRSKTVNRYLFHRAVYDPSFHGRTIPLKFIPYREYKPFRQYVTQLIRCTENKLREMAGFRGRLKEIVLLPETQALIERFLEKEQLQARRMSREIRIDTDRLASLQEDTEVVQRLLTVEYEEENEGGEEAETVHADLAERQAWTELSSSVEASSSMERSPSIVPSPSIESSSSGIMETENTAAVSAEDWQEIKARLQPVHLQVLSLLLSGEPVVKELASLAAQYGSMPELLIDEINDAAMETIGDLLIEDFTVMDEHIDLVREIMGEQFDEST